MDNFENSQPTTSFWPKNFKIKKKRAVVTSSDDSDQETQIDFSKSKTKSQATDIENNVNRPKIDHIRMSNRSKFLHLQNYLKFCCEDCNFTTTSGEDFEWHLMQHNEDTFCEELENKNEKKENVENTEENTFQLSEIIAKQSQDLLSENL